MRFTAFTRSESCSGFESEEHVVVYVNQLRVIGEVRSDAWYGWETNRLITFCAGRCGDVGTKPESTDDASNGACHICDCSTRNSPVWETRKTVFWAPRIFWKGMDRSQRRRGSLAQSTFRRWENGQPSSASSA